MSEVEREEATLDQKGIVERLQEHPVRLIEASEKLSVASVQELAPGQKIVLCDAHIHDIEHDQPITAGSSTDGKPTVVGFAAEAILNIDHHSPIREMSRQISSTNLAIEYVRANGPVPADTVAIINHTDCDSVLSLAIMTGILEPKDVFGAAAIAADHTGEANEIADLLQSFDGKRDIEFSLRNLELFLDGKPLEPEAEELLNKRLHDRERAAEVVQNEFINYQNSGLYYARLDTKIDCGLVPALIPDAKVIALFSPMGDAGTYEVKVRLGMAAPEGIDLRDIMKEVDPNWGGRWNAGSNKRRGGTTTSIEQYVRAISSRLEQPVT